MIYVGGDETEYKHSCTVTEYSSLYGNWDRFSLSVWLSLDEDNNYCSFLVIFSLNMLELMPSV